MAVLLADVLALVRSDREVASVGGEVRQATSDIVAAVEHARDDVSRALDAVAVRVNGITHNAKRGASQPEGPSRAKPYPAMRRISPRP